MKRKSMSYNQNKIKLIHYCRGEASPLWYASIDGNVDIIDILLDFGAGVHYGSSEWKDTALHAAARGGR
jgi:hypothetical protein